MLLLEVQIRFGLNIVWHYYQMIQIGHLAISAPVILDGGGRIRIRVKPSPDPQPSLQPICAGMTSSPNREMPREIV